MRDLIFALAMLIAIPLAIAKPLNAYYLWGWTAVLIPTSYFYGFMVSARMNLFFALLTLAMIVLGRVKWRDYVPNALTWFYLVFLAHGTMSYLLGYADNPNNAVYHDILLKGMVCCLVMPLFIDSRLRLHMMIMVIVLGLGMHGVLNGLKTLASGGGHNMYGPMGSMLADRNHLSVAMALSLPLFYYLYVYAAHWLVRLALLGGLASVALAVLGGGSRGGFLAMSVVGFWIVMTTRHRGRALALVGAAAIGYLAFAPDSWTDRLSTIQEASEDASFMGRVIAWEISSAIALSNPVFGGGFHAVQVQHVWDQFKGVPGLLSLDVPMMFEIAPKAAHSIYFEVMGDLGFVGLLLFLSLLLYTLLSRFRIRRMTMSLGPEFVWARDMADALMVAVIAYMVGGAGVSLAYFEVIYMVMMLMELLRVLVKRAYVERLTSS